MTGIFVTVEGPEGSGKTTLIQNLGKRLTEKINLEVLLTREPGGNPIAEDIRRVILDLNYTQMDPRTEALLYAAARRQHLVDNVLPALNANKLVLCDRFVDSSVVYQGYARGVDIEGVLAINNFAIDTIKPDLTFYLDLPVEIGLERIYKQRLNEVNRFDNEQLPFHEKVRAGYLEVAKKNTDRIIIVDALLDFEEIVDVCYMHLLQRFPQLFEK